MTEAAEPDPHDELRAFLREQVRLTPSRKPSGYASVKAVLPEIRALKTRRRTDAEIQEMLARMGVRLSLATLRQYVQSATRELAGHKPARRRGKALARPPAKTSPASAQHQPALVHPPAAAREPLPAGGRASAARTVGHQLSTKDL
ncbi:hypothetical protein [Methylobacterium brachiatum]|uniref:hypothetical protein n=1 Tax=Methylobacterium brachiatum TaxID=269660 RepID=UPI002447F0C4|nr:hypothetical protein [Methylobacterium brachiatum]MDH2313903.1 hypothetical protein [Methylobacterium brachiatum]